jgi:hypothetical protein
VGYSEKHSRINQIFLLPSLTFIFRLGKIFTLRIKTVNKVKKKKKILSTIAKIKFLKNRKN